MNQTSGRTRPLWLQTAEMPPAQELTRNQSGDVVIVGAGISGLTTAYLLAKQGKKVIVVDDGKSASGETGRTTAHLSNAFDDRYYEMERIHGAEACRVLAESHTAAINLIEHIAREEQIDCDFERLDGYLFLSKGDSTEILAKELDAAHRAGLSRVTRLDRAPLTAFNTGPCLRFPDQGQFHVTKYLRGVSAALQALGGEIYNGVHAVKMEGGNPAKVTTSAGLEVTAKDLVVATNSPVNDLVAIHTKQFPYRTYVIGCRLQRGRVEPGLYWDTADPYHYVRLQAVDDYDILIVGGEDHKTGHEPEPGSRHDCLEKWTRERFPMIQSVDFRWSGQVMEPQDGVAFIGRNPMDHDNVYIVTGDSGMGMTHGTIAGMIISDLIAGRENTWASFYDPGRVRLKAATEFVKDAGTMAINYADWIMPGDVKSVVEIPNGEGAVIRRGLHKIAVYKDEAGRVIERSAVCTHLGCVVQWNKLEKTWDCPCHGSRFSCTGDEVLNGPASKGLQPAE